MKIGSNDHDGISFDANELTTHAVILGMTGSGKTGLGIVLLEELATKGVPVFILDIKGDMANIPLVFDTDDNKLKLLKSGIPVSKSDLCPESYYRISKNIYTPGSSINPVNIMSSLSVPDGWQDNKEDLRENLSFVTSSILSLVKVVATPSNIEHVYISKIIEWHWDRGYNLTLSSLVNMANDPPFSKIGVLPVNDGFPARARTKLIRSLNTLVSNPNFDLWMQGQPIDFNQNGINIFYLAHLPEFEKNFFISMFYNELYTWMKKQEGTDELRLVTYLDECVGILPPYPKNPPTKEVLLRLLKQGRAYGVGTILATQNPKDMDYKSISNIGTWFIGTLQTSHDRNRIYEGMQVDKSIYDAKIKSLNSREFIMHTSDGDITFRSRDTYADLIGPITKQQIENLHQYLSGVVFKNPIRMENYYLPVTTSPHDVGINSINIVYYPVLYAETTLGAFISDGVKTQRFDDLKLGNRIENVKFYKNDLDAKPFIETLAEMKELKIQYVNEPLKIKSRDAESKEDFMSRIRGICILRAKEESNSMYDKWKMEYDIIQERLSDITQRIEQVEIEETDTSIISAVKTSYLLSYGSLKSQLEKHINEEKIRKDTADVIDSWKDKSTDIKERIIEIENRIKKSGILWVPYYIQNGKHILAWRNK